MNALTSAPLHTENGAVDDTPADSNVAGDVINLARAGRAAQRVLAKMSSGERAAALVLGAAASILWGAAWAPVVATNRALFAAVPGATAPAVRQAAAQTLAP
jgi:hypothetical protein